MSNSIRRLAAAYLLVLLACCVWLPRPHAEARQELAEGRGRDVAAHLCAGACHDVDKVTENRASKQEWFQIIDDMKSRGATGTEDEFKTVGSYLTAHYGKTVKINEAAAKELDAALDLGPGQADAIVTYRNEHGKFAEWKDLLRVPGLDQGTLEEQKQNVVF